MQNKMTPDKINIGNMVIFHPLGYFWMPIVTLWKDEVAQRNGNILNFFWQSKFFTLSPNQEV
jgi:hypothetical protein